MKKFILGTESHWLTFALTFHHGSFGLLDVSIQDSFSLKQNNFTCYVGKNIITDFYGLLYTFHTMRHSLQWSVIDVCRVTFYSIDKYANYFFCLENQLSRNSLTFSSFIFEQVKVRDRGCELHGWMEDSSQQCELKAKISVQLEPKSWNKVRKFAVFQISLFHLNFHFYISAMCQSWPFYFQRHKRCCQLFTIKNESWFWCQSESSESFNTGIMKNTDVYL